MSTHKAAPTSPPISYRAKITSRPLSDFVHDPASEDEATRPP